MARPLRIVYPGAFYHITSRGNERKDIFREQEDRERFLSYLQSANQRYEALIHVFCLMDNHYHILMETPLGNLPQIMMHINGAYTTYFNVKHQRSGHLFQGRYKAILVDKDEYAKELSRYIHLNPVRAGMVDRPEEYLWSSYQYYIGCKKPPKWLENGFILDYFGNKHSIAQKRYRAFVHDLIEREYKNPMEATVSSTILGSVDFIESIKDKYLSDKKADPNLPALKELSGKPSINEIAEYTKSILGEDRALSRGIQIYLICKYSGKMLNEIGRCFNIGASGVSQASRRIAIKMDKDSGLREKVCRIENSLKLSRMKT